MGNRQSKKVKANNKAEAGKKKDYSYKLLIVGDATVGKTSLLKSFIDKTFSSEHEVTLGVDFKSSKLNYNGNTVNLSMWDTAGQERFREFTKAYYKTADGIIIVFDVCNGESFENLDTWFENVADFTKNAKKVLVGNKCDLEDQRVVSHERAQAYAEKMNVKLIETSAKDGDNVNDVFYKIVDELTYYKSDISDN
jgi:small GTP-binding protein